MVSNIETEIDYLVPIWSVDQARQVLDYYTNKYNLPAKLLSLTYKETFMLLFTKFTVRIWGTSAGAIKVMNVSLIDELGAL